MTQSDSRYKPRCLSRISSENSGHRTVAISAQFQPDSNIPVYGSQRPKNMSAIARFPSCKARWEQHWQDSLDSSYRDKLRDQWKIRLSLNKTYNPGKSRQNKILFPEAPENNRPKIIA